MGFGLGKRAVRGALKLLKDEVLVARSRSRKGNRYFSLLLRISELEIPVQKGLDILRAYWVLTVYGKTEMHR